MPAASSTSGYWDESRVLQVRHLPRKRKKLNTGISSNHESRLLQDLQEDGSRMERLVSRRKLHAFIKLPIESPRRRATDPRNQNI